MFEQEFQDRVVLVTGGSAGIGAATAKAFAHAGAQVALNYHSNRAGAEETRSEIVESGGHCRVYQIDLRQLEEAMSVVEEIEEEFGVIDVLVNNAAAFNREPFLEVSPEEFERVWRTNVHGMYFLTQRVATSMALRGSGSIVNVSSILARLSMRSRTAYCASKGAVESLTKAMALDLASHDVRVNAVVPGLIRTESLLSGLPGRDLQAAIAEHIPAKRFGEPAEAADVILFLASEAASYINGALIPVDAGLSAQEPRPMSEE